MNRGSYVYVRFLMYDSERGEKSDSGNDDEVNHIIRLIRKREMKWTNNYVIFVLLLLNFLLLLLSSFIVIIDY